jgi:glycosyltransferase involved in cell wall biosynthesis
MKRELTICTPFYNEADTLENYFRRIEFVRAKLVEAGWTETLLLIDDGSRDKTGDALEAYARAHAGVRAVRHPRNLGYGSAIKTALALSRTEWTVFVDADTNYDQAIVLELAAKADDTVDLMNVSIFAPGGHAAFPWHRKLLSQSASFIYKATLPLLTRDIHTMTCGFRFYRTAVVPRIFPVTGTFVATSEIMIRALREGLRVLEVPAANQPRRFGRSKMKVVSESLAHLRLALTALTRRLGPPLPVEDHLRLIGQPSSKTS